MPALCGHHTGELKVDAAPGAHLAKMRKLAWLVFQPDTEEVRHNLPSARKSNTSESTPIASAQEAAAADGADHGDDLAA